MSAGLPPPRPSANRYAGPCIEPARRAACGWATKIRVPISRTVPDVRDGFRRWRRRRSVRADPEPRRQPVRDRRNPHTAARLLRADLVGRRRRHPRQGRRPTPARRRANRRSTPRRRTWFYGCWVRPSGVDRHVRAAGQKYQPTTLVFYRGGTQSGCGAAQSAMGPFYCPADQSIYLDTAFFSELAQRFAAPGDFAQAYVIAHEVGHHVQTLTARSSRRQPRAVAVRRGRGNALQVAWSCRPTAMPASGRRASTSAMEPGDLEEGMRAADAIGDDTLQRADAGHGRARKLHPRQRGAAPGGADARPLTGNPAACNFAR